MANAFHKIGDLVSRIHARLEFAFAALTGKFPLPTPLERKTIMTIFERLDAQDARLAALEAGATATASIAAAASSGANQAAGDVDSLTARVTTLETEVGTPSLVLDTPVPVDGTVAA